MRLWVFCFIALTLSFSLIAVGQMPEEKSKYQQTTKFGEFGDVGEKEYKPILEAFFKEVRNNSEQGYVIFYGDMNGTPFQKTQFFAMRKTHSYHKYLSCRCFDSPRITYIFAGLSNKMKTELWLASNDGERPKLSALLGFEKDELYRLEKLGEESINLNSEKIKKEIIAATESKNSDETDSEIKADFQDRIDLNDFGNKVAEVLSKDKTWRAVLFFYADKDEYDIEKSRQIIESELSPLLKTSKVDFNRVKIIYGGYRLNPQIESWIIPKDGIEPEPMPDEKIEEN